MVATRGRPPEEELEAFLAVGYAERQVLEIILAIAVKTLRQLFEPPIRHPARRGVHPSRLDQAGGVSELVATGVPRVCVG